MTTHFITAEIELPLTTTQLQKQIEETLQKEGTPLRWSIAAIEEEKAKIEAIVTK